MKKSFLFIAFISILSIALYSCSSKAPEEAKMIPKDASMVSVIDPGLLQAKLEKGNISIDSVFDKMFHNVSDSNHADLKKKFDDLRNNSGIDWSNKIFCFVEQKKYANNGTGVTVNVIAHLKDSAKFTKYINQFDEIKGRDVVKDKSFTYVQMDYKGMVSWTDKIVMTTIFNYTERPTRDSVFHTYQIEGINKTKAIKEEVTRFFSLKEDESLASVTPFTDMFKQKNDAYFFHSTSGLANSLSMMPIQLPKLNDLLQDNYMASTFNFDEGKITGTSATYTNKTLSAILKAYTGSTINLSMVENYPSDNVDLAFLASFNPEMINAIIKELDVDALGDLFMQKMNLKTADIYKCLKGDVAVIVSDFAWKKTNDSSLFKSKPSVKYIINASVGDTAVYHKLLNRALEDELIVKQNNVYKSGKLLQSLGMFLNADDKNFMMASDSVLYNQYVSKTGKAGISKEILDEIKGKSTAGFVDIDKIIGGFASSKDTSNNQTIKTLQATFKDIISTSENFDGTKIKSKSAIRFKDEKENSLVTLIKTFMKIAPTLKKTSAGTTVDDIKTLPFIRNLIFIPTVRI
jgi:hypothetical protein